MTFHARARTGAGVLRDVCRVRREPRLGKAGLAGCQDHKPCPRGRHHRGQLLAHAQPCQPGRGGADRVPPPQQAQERRVRRRGRHRGDAQARLIELGKKPGEVFEALKNQTVELVLTAHPTRAVTQEVAAAQAHQVS
jgi:hypothetical protein